jgi:hypothetical protein
VFSSKIKNTSDDSITNLVLENYNQIRYTSPTLPSEIIHSKIINRLRSLGFKGFSPLDISLIIDKFFNEQI